VKPNNSCYFKKSERTFVERKERPPPLEMMEHPKR
jgi:hypothetical protein